MQGQDAGSEVERQRLLDDALDLLDFPEVRAQIASDTTFPRAREMALALKPSYDPGEIEVRHRETAEAAILLEDGRDVALRSVDDVSVPVARAEKGGLLTGRELLGIAEMIDVQARARAAALSPGRPTPILAAIASGISDLSDVRRRITASIGPRGEVLDGASPGLGILRRQARQAYEEVAAALGRVIDSRAGEDALQDSVVSMRSDRLVVQVKTGHRHRVPGVVHGASNTGATLFVEPFATVDLGNRWREVVLEEEREIERALRDLSAAVGAVAREIESGAELTARLDFIMARARYGARRGYTAIAVQGGRDSDGAIRLMQARHPLLGRDAVPVNVKVSPERPALVITGPNMGGKTAALKTTGLLAVMHQSGLPIPVEEGSALPVFDGVYADIGDQQSIQESVSTFGSHARNLAAIVRHATPRSLALLDELGSSTDPDEGSALAKAVLNHVVSVGAWAIATTHHRSVAVHAETAEGMSNASVELDARTLMPTYHLTLGVPGRSYAISVAEQVGLPAEILDDARSLMEPRHLLFEDWLLELQASRQQLKERVEAADRTQAEAEASRKEFESRLEEFEASRGDMLLDMRRGLEAEHEDTRRRLRQARAALSWSAPSGEPVEPRVEEAAEALDQARKAMPKIQDSLAPPEVFGLGSIPHVHAGRSSEIPPSAAREARRPRGPLSVGDLVSVRGMDVRGSVETIDERAQEAEVIVGNVQLRVALGRLSHADEKESTGEHLPEVRLDLGPVLGSMEVDLRGMRSEDALMRVEEFLDRAVRDGLASVRIVHGKGTGALRQAVRELLEHHPLAKSFGQEAPANGGSGATFVELT